MIQDRAMVLVVSEDCCMELERSLQKVFNLEQNSYLHLKESVLYSRSVWRRHSVHGDFQPGLSDRSDKIMIIL